VTPDEKKKKRAEFVEFAKHVEGFPISMIATASLNAPGTTEHQIEDLATKAVTACLDLLRADHEDNVPHENHEEEMESLVRSAIRKGMKLQPTVRWSTEHAEEFAKEIVDQIDKRPFDEAERLIRTKLIEFGNNAWAACAQGGQASRQLTPATTTKSEQNMLFDLKCCIPIIEKLLMGFYTKAPESWMKQQAEQASSILWMLKEVYEPRRNEEV